MRQLFIDKESTIIKQATQIHLDDYAVLIAVHYSFLSSTLEIAHLAQAKASAYSNVPSKIKKLLAQVHKKIITADDPAEINSASSSNRYSFGYSCSGQVMAVGSQVTTLRVGDFVACAGSEGAHYADLIQVPESLVAKIHDSTKIKASSLAAIGTKALHAVRRAQLQIGERVCVIGLGLLGQLTVQLAKRAGCFVIAIDLVDDRLNIAQDCGADAIFHATRDEVFKSIMMLTQHHGVDVVLIAAASDSASIINQAVAITRKKGRIVCFGAINLSIDRAIFYEKEIDLLTAYSYGAGRGDYPYESEGIDYPYYHVRWTAKRNMQAFIELIENGFLRIEPLISREVTIDVIDEVYRHIKEKKVLAVLLRFAHKDIRTDFSKPAILSPAVKKIEFIPAIKDTVRVGIMGADNGAYDTIVPMLAKVRNVQMSVVADADERKAQVLSQTFGGAKVCLTLDEMFSTDCTDVIIVSSDHHLHAEHIMNALARGKAVFAQQPLATNFVQFQKIVQLLNGITPAPLCVNFYRSFAPFINKIKKVVDQRNTPLMISYRMNASLTHYELRTSMHHGAGRILSDACHIIDLFVYLTQAKPMSVSVEALHGARTDIFPTDNFATTISFSDGSVCSLLYTVQGHEKMGAERMELFFDGKSIIMDDYVGLYGFGTHSWLNETVSVPDYGRSLLIDAFFKALKSDVFIPPISFDRLATTARLALTIDQLACEGGGTQNI